VENSKHLKKLKSNDIGTIIKVALEELQHRGKNF
jgi:hypothetical protein